MGQIDVYKPVKDWLKCKLRPPKEHEPLLEANPPSQNGLFVCFVLLFCFSRSLGSFKGLEGLRQAARALGPCWDWHS